MAAAAPAPVARQPARSARSVSGSFSGVVDAFTSVARERTRILESMLREFLQGTPFFGGLVDEALDRVIGMLVERHVPARSEVIHQGQNGSSMYVVHTGQLVVYKESATGSVRLVRLGPGDFFGETALITVQPRTATIVAETEAVLYELSSQALYHLYEQDVQSYVMVLQNINRELCRRLRAADERIVKLACDMHDEQTQIRRPR